MGIFEKFKSGFKKSASAFTTGLRDIVVKKEIDDKTLDKIEDYLIQSDVGIVSASEIREIISQTKIDPNKDLTDEINNILKSDDVLHTLNAFKSMGVSIEENSNKIIIQGKGLNSLNKSNEKIYLGNSGTSARLLTGLLSSQKFRSVLTGDKSLSSRPMKRYHASWMHCKWSISSRGTSNLFSV